MDDTYMDVKELMLTQYKNLDDKLQQVILNQTPVDRGFDFGTSIRVKWIKEKNKIVSGKRLKGGLEKNLKKRKPTRKISQKIMILVSTL